MSSAESTVRKPATARTGRRTRGKATRARIVTAATKLFIRDGYLATTMAAIAAEAEVAVQSLYLSFGGKLGILKAVLDVAIVGDDEPVPLLERDWVQQLAATPNGPQAVRLLVREVRHMFTRKYPIYAALHAAAASDAGELLAKDKRDRRAGVGVIAAYLSQKPGFTPDLSVEMAGDVIYGLASEDHYGLLVADCGWTPEAWERWCADTLVSILFPGGQEAGAQL